MACITQNGSCNNVVKSGTLCVRAYMCFAQYRFHISRYVREISVHVFLYWA